MHHKRQSGFSSEELGSCLVIAEFEYSDDGYLFYLKIVVCHARRNLATSVGSRSGVVGYKTFEVHITRYRGAFVQPLLQ